MIRQWSRARFATLSAVAGVIALLTALTISRLGRRRVEEQETRRELVLAASTVHGGVLVYDSRVDRALPRLDADIARLRRSELGLMLGIGVVAVVWAGLARDWLSGRASPRRPRTSTR